MKIVNYRDLGEEKLLMRCAETAGVADTVSDIIADVAANGDEALRRYAKKFDGADLTAIEVTKKELDQAMASVDPELLDVLRMAAENIREFHTMQLRQGFSYQRSCGAILSQRITPIEKAGLYIPGGTASYPSTVLMNAIPAKIAGCSQIIMVSPPSRGGTIAAPILAAAVIAGVDRVFKVGGAQAIAALAYGTQTVPKVDKIVGPGNAFVAEAKRQVFGRVSIDMIAGPSEILVIADKTADPVFVAADLLSQAEHDKLASAVLVTDSTTLAQRVSEEVEIQLSQLPRQEIARTSIENNGRIIVTEDLFQAIDAANELAPEHLELCVEDPMGYLDHVKNAGSVFLGHHCPEALGDYLAGPNHTLPTSGTARFSSPLSVDDFIKKTQCIYYPPEALRAVKEKITRFARSEGLEAHARAALKRFEGERP